MTVAVSTKARFPRERLAGIFVSGGETAARVLAAADAKGIDLSGERVAGIMEGRLRGGTFGGLPCAIKPGGFGSVDSLARWLEGFRGG